MDIIVILAQPVCFICKVPPALVEKYTAESMQEVTKFDSVSQKSCEL